MTTVTADLIGQLPADERDIARAFGAVVREADDARLTEWAKYHGEKIDAAFAHGGHPGGHVLLLSIVQDEQDRRYYEDGGDDRPNGEQQPEVDWLESRFDDAGYEPDVD